MVAVNDYGLQLFDHHATLLAESAISEQVARERGYRTASARKELGSRGFSSGQQKVPGLLIPVYDETGAVALHQYRPDEPRVTKAGKAVKYETPAKARMCVDVPPPVRGHLGDPSRPLWLTEGVRKADAAVSAGIDCLALLGVWNWRGRNEHEGLTALAFWESVALNDRRVYIAFDSDVMLKAGVHAALVRLGAFLARRGAKIAYAYLPSEDGGKVGLDDYLAAGGTVAEIVRSARSEPLDPPAPERTPEGRAPEPERAASATPSGPPEDGAGLLDAVRAFLSRFVAFPSVAALAAVTLWPVHAHLMEAWENTPRLALLSPEPGSGKTRVLEVLELLCPDPMHVLNVSPAAIFRTIEKARPTLLLDEVDTVFTRSGKDDEHQDLRGVLNGGYRAGATIPRCTGPLHEVRQFPTFCAVALAGLGDLPDTLMTRSVIIRMRRRAPGEHVEAFRRRLHKKEGEALRDRLAAWAETITEQVTNVYPNLPNGITDRNADVWEPLLAVADAAGGEWPKRARDACVALVKAARSTDSGSLGVRLLTDLRTVFGPAQALSTKTILEKLHGLPEAPWADLRGKPLDPRGLARRLGAYDVHSMKVKIDGKSVQGYRREHLWDAWQRYVPPISAEPEPVEPSEPGRSETSDEVPEDDQVPEPDSDAEPADPSLTCNVPKVPQVPALRGTRDERQVARNPAQSVASDTSDESALSRDDDGPECIGCRTSLPEGADACADCYQRGVVA